MASWTFEPGHTAAAFKARHMMVTWVRGHFKNVRGTMNFDIDNPNKMSVDIEIDASEISSGVKMRDDHLKSADFLDVENHPLITFKGDQLKQVGADAFKLTGDLMIRGTTKKITLDVQYLGQWQTPFWVDGKDLGPKQRLGFMAWTQLNRHDFGVSWNDTMDKGGVVVSDELELTIDVEALLDE